MQEVTPQSFQLKMAEFKQNTKLMAKNSAFMYIQMGIKMLIGLYTVRVFLHALGVEDYGIYNVVAGFVSMFSFVSNTLVSTSQRFFAYSIGRQEDKMVNRYFNATLLCFIILSLVLFVIIEGIGYWFVNYKMVIPDNRLEAANWVLQFAIISFLVRILVVPFRGLIVAHEKLIIYALISVFDAFLILGIAFFIQWVPGDKLKVYSLCTFSVALISSILFVVLCRTNFREDSKLRIRWEKELIVELLSYSGWSLFGTMATVVRTQGINMILNVFFGPVVNAARAIAAQILHAINQFVTSFYNAVRPQITKLNATENVKGMLSLVYNSSVISFFLLSLVVVPLLVEMPFVLSFWLGDYPQYTVIFSRLIVITAVIDVLGQSVGAAIYADGDIRNYQVITGLILILNLPVSYLLFRIYTNPSLAFYVSIIMSSIAQFVRIVFMKQRFGMSIWDYFKKVILPISVVFGLSILVSYGLRRMHIGSGIWPHVVTIVGSVIATALLSFFVGIRKEQRHAIMAGVKGMLNKRGKKNG